MKRLSVWMLLLSAMSLAACQSNATNCAGWKPISLKPATAVYLAENDVQAGQGIAGHNAYGHKACGWG